MIKKKIEQGSDDTQSFESDVKIAMRINDEVLEFMEKYENIDRALLATIFGNILIQLCKSMNMNPRQFQDSLYELGKIYELQITRIYEKTVT